MSFDSPTEFFCARKKIKPLCAEIFNFGGDEGDRTPDLLNAIQALSQLSYAPVTCA